VALQPDTDHDLLIPELPRSRATTHHLRTSDNLVAVTCTWQNTTLTRDKHPCPLRDSNPKYKQASGRRPTP